MFNYSKDMTLEEIEEENRWTNKFLHWLFTGEGWVKGLEK